MNRLLIKNTSIVNEGRIILSDVLIIGERIENISSGIAASNATVIEAEGLYLLPGLIDDQVHFREPGLTHKGDISSESKAAVAGGITSYMDMPNTIPNTLSLKLLEEKYKAASQRSHANYSFFMGINQSNLEEALRTDTENVCGITDDGLYFNNEDGILANYPEFLEKLFARSNTLIALHSEDDVIIKNNMDKYRELGDQIPFSFHPLIRSEDACLTATKRVIEIAKRHGNRLHLFHISSAAEAKLFDANAPIRKKRITGEACVHHLWFSDKDYEKLGSKIKWNPSIKTENDKNGLLQSLVENRLDIIATDHAPHTTKEKAGNYYQAPSGGPLVQHALPILLELYHLGKISLEQIVKKTSHHVAEIYRIKERGYLREGYYADMVLLDLVNPWRVTTQNLFYKCNWSPMEKYLFKSKVIKTILNGHVVYDHGTFSGDPKGKRLQFEKTR